MKGFLNALDYELPRNKAEAIIRDAAKNGAPLPFNSDLGDYFTTRLLHNEGPNGKAAFHRPDVWHVVCMGIGKAWLASSMHVIQEERVLPGSSLDTRFAAVSQEYLQFCRSTHRTAYVNKLDKQVFGPGGKVEPTGAWSKAAFTVTLGEFLEHFAENHKEKFAGNHKLEAIETCHWFERRIEIYFSFWYTQCTGNNVFSNHCETKAAGTRALGDFMRGLYHNDLWIESENAQNIAASGLYFIRAYMYMAKVSMEERKPRFGLYPKLHFLHEVVMGLQLQAEIPQVRWVYNPIAESCAQDEDFIGRVAFVTRCVSPRLTALRSLERYAVHIRMLWS